ncbi:unnamed protein product [Peronospora effusa]|nr:unnamed protein product [Peronospora effusa]
MAALVLLQECVPLQDPTEGWSANFGFWIRVAILGGVVAVGIAAFVAYMIPGVVLSKRQLTLIFIGQAIGYPAVGMLVAALWVFPIPFMVLTIMTLFVLVFIVLFRIIVGKQTFSQMATHKEQLILLVSFSGSQCVMAFTYAAYEVLFEHVTGTFFELPVVLLLPVIKVIMKKVVSLAIVHMEDMIPEGVIFTVDFFNSMYLATCMQNTSSITTVAAVMVLDFGQTAISLRSLHKRSDTILSRLHQACGITLKSDSLLPVVRLLCRDKDKFEQQDRQDVLLYSCLPHKVSQDGQSLLKTLEHVPDNGVCKLPQFMISKPWSHSRRKETSVVPSNAKPIAIVRPAQNQQEPAESVVIEVSVPPHQNILRETLGVLFTSECLILTEYMEFIIPVLYGNFILLVVNLPSARYHMDLLDVNLDNVADTLLNVYVYALLEFASFLTLTLMMMRNCRLQAIYHLAFVLETQALLVQVKLMTWVLMSLSFRVIHFGADFTFQFSWMTHNNA